VIVRDATRDEVPAIARLHALSQRTAYAELLPADAVARIDDDTWIAKWITRVTSPGMRAVMIATSDVGQLLGFAMATRERAGWAVLNSLHVHPSAYRRGIGQQLHDAVLERARAWDCHWARLSVLRGNHRARAFYEHNRWRPAGPGDDHAIAEHPVETVQYVKSLLSGRPATTRPFRPAGDTTKHSDPT
jgi:ribosomal protein S18 acetylase RimI-like enzyme